MMKKQGIVNLEGLKSSFDMGSAELCEPCLESMFKAI